MKESIKKEKQPTECKCVSKGYPPPRATFDRKTDAKIWVQQDVIDRYVYNVLPTKKKREKRQGAQLLWRRQQIGRVLLSNLTPSLIAEQRDKLLSRWLEDSPYA